MNKSQQGVGNPPTQQRKVRALVGDKRPHGARWQAGEIVTVNSEHKGYIWLQVRGLGAVLAPGQYEEVVP